MGTIKDINGMDLTEAIDIKKFSTLGLFPVSKSLGLERKGGLVAELI